MLTLGSPHRGVVSDLGQMRQQDIFQIGFEVLLCPSLHSDPPPLMTSLQALPLVDSRPPDVAQIPQELQPNLITAAVAMGLQHAPVIQPGSDRLAHRWACFIKGRNGSALSVWLAASNVFFMQGC